ncbi:MAG TPA: hypothetical protein VGK74_02820 [Symbiobacteriaceae bacterium]|jgi:hypothetical protein
MTAIVTWFGSDLWLALTGVLIAAGVDCGLTVALALLGKLGEPFSWKRLPQFAITNVLPATAALLAGAVLVKYVPDLQAEYLGAALLVSGYLAKDWRQKAKRLFVAIGSNVPAPPQA